MLIAQVAFVDALDAGVYAANKADPLMALADEVIGHGKSALHVVKTHVTVVPVGQDIPQEQAGDASVLYFADFVHIHARVPDNQHAGHAALQKLLQVRALQIGVEAGSAHDQGKIVFRGHLLGRAHRSRDLGGGGQD